MPIWRTPRRRLLAICALALAAGALAAGARPAPDLPAIVFVSRHAVPGESGAIPGLGPHHRAVATGGRLLVLERGGVLRPLLPEGALFDVSDPAVGPDGARVAFAGTPDADSAWRIYVVGLDGRGLAAVTHRGDAGAARHDDLDPCWISDRTLVFASTRYSQRAQYADLPVTNLYRVELPAGPPRRLTSERNGAEEPCFDPATGRVLFARWWYNRHRPSDRAAGGVTTRAAEALPADSANLWQAMEMWPDGTGMRLAAGWLRTRRGAMAYQPAVLEAGSILGVYAANLALSPRAAGTGIQAFERRFEGARRLAGADPGAGEDGYGGTRGLAAPSACAPAAVPPGRVLFAYDPGARGDFGIYAMNADGSGLRSVVDLPGTLELDPAPVVRRSVRALPHPQPQPNAAARGHEPPLLPATDFESLIHTQARFRFQCLNVFAGGSLGSEGGLPPPPAPAARVRFFATLARAGAAGGDSAVLVREAPVGRDGSIDESDLPAGTPMFEQIVDRGGRILRTTRGPAHGLGSNAAAEGETMRCVGCHLGHSTLLERRPRAYADPRWFDAASSAEVTASSFAAGTAGPRAAVDRRARGTAAEVAWVAGGDRDEWLRLAWSVPLVVRSVVLYAPRGTFGGGPGRRAWEVVALRDGRETLRRELSRAPVGSGTRIALGEVTLDALEVRASRAATGGRDPAPAAIAEVEVFARLAAE